MITLSQISKNYKEFSLNNINLQIQPAEFVSILGSSGSGKSTLLKIILGVVDDYQGGILINGQSIKGKSPIELGISMVFQNPLLLPHLTVEENIAFGLEMTKIGRAEQQQRVNQVLQDVYLEGFNHRYPYELSGGQQQRVSLARALVMQPKLLLMDEPFSALDQNLRIEMQKLLKNIQQKYQNTIVFVTHDRDEAFFLSDKIALFQHGNLLQFDSPSRLYNNPNCIDVASFLGIQNIFTGQIIDEKFIHSDFVLDMQDRSVNKESVKIAIKSTDISITDIQPNIQYVSGILQTQTLRHGIIELEVKVGDRIWHLKQSKNPKINIGATVFLSYNVEDIIIFV